MIASDEMRAAFAIAIIAWFGGALGCTTAPNAHTVVTETTSSNRGVPAIPPDPPEQPTDCRAVPDELLNWFDAPLAAGTTDEAPSKEPMKACTFPSAATVDAAVVEVALRIDATGRVVATAIACEAPTGQGFAASARDCATKARFTPARGADGTPVSSTTKIRIRFVR